MNNFLKRRRFNKDLKRLAGDKAAQAEPLSVMNDVVFKAMLTKPSNGCTRSSFSTVYSILIAASCRGVTATGKKQNTTG